MPTSHITPLTELKRNLSFLILGQKGGRNRMEIITLLRDRPYNINQLADRLRLNYRTVKHHIDILLKYQLISSSKTGGYGDVFFLSPDLEGNLHLYDGIIQKLDTVKHLADFTDSPLFFRSVLEQTSEAVIILDNEWDVFFWNKSAYRIFGYSSDEVLHGPLNFFFDERSLTEMKERLSKSKRLDDMGSNGTNRSGERIEICITMNPIEKDSSTIGYFMLIRDLTESNRTHIALKKAEMEAAQQKELAMLGLMAAGVGHELYNPLASIKNAAYFLGMTLEKVDPEVREMVDILNSEAAETERIIKTLLDFARSGPTARKRSDINALVLRSVSRTAVPDNIKVSNRLSRTLPKVYGDPDQLAIVFGNVVLNAVQAMPEGGTLTIRSQTSGSDAVAVHIKDTGKGIPEEDLDKIFDPLFTTRPKGIGLGLAIAKRTVDAHGGTIEVRNEDGAGCTVTITVPIGAKEVPR